MRRPPARALLPPSSPVARAPLPRRPRRWRSTQLSRLAAPLQPRRAPATSPRVLVPQLAAGSCSPASARAAAAANPSSPAKPLSYGHAVRRPPTCARSHPSSPAASLCHGRHRHRPLVRPGRAPCTNKLADAKNRGCGRKSSSD